MKQTMTADTRTSSEPSELNFRRLAETFTSVRRNGSFNDLLMLFEFLVDEAAWCVAVYASTYQAKDRNGVQAERIAYSESLMSFEDELEEAFPDAFPTTVGEPVSSQHTEPIRGQE